jgi:hypothetical protein
MLAYEVKATSETIKLKVTHWHIESGNHDAFTMNGKIYKSVSIIIGESREHWYCWNRAGDKSYGSRYRKSNELQSESSKRLAIFSIENDNEATFLVKNHNGYASKCTPSAEGCANNCLYCKKFMSPFSKNNDPKRCACFPAIEEFKSIEESDLDEDSDDDDIVQVTQIDQGARRKGMWACGQQLKAINEE